MQTPKHQPVLASEVLNLLAPQPGEVYFDGTAGYGGHAEIVWPMIQPGGRIILVDQDQMAVTALQQKFGQSAEIRHQNYVDAANELVGQSQKVDMVLLDLGVSSPQFDRPERGFSFSQDGPLDMRMDQSQNLTAAEVVNSYGERELAGIIYQYGEEPRSRRIARAIVSERPFHSTVELARVVSRIAHRGKIHPATRTFQALRIFVNDELDRLSQALPILTDLLNPGGRLAVISFHSLEDRIVKRFIQQNVQLSALTKKVVKGETNDAFNPRARSAKLRAAVKLNQNQKEGQ